MSRNTVSRILYGCFILVFFVMVGIMVKGLIDQNNDENKQIARYEQMKSAENKTLLTDEILKEDHDKYLQDSTKSKKMAITLFSCFGIVVIWLVITVIITNVMALMEKNGTESFAVLFAISIAAVFLTLAFFAVMLKAIIPGLTRDQSKDAYFLSEFSLADSEKVEEVVSTGTGENRTTETRIYYYLIEDNGEKIGVSKLLYNRYEGPGIYYAGQTSRGNIYSLYPAKYFEPGSEVRKGK